MVIEPYALVPKRLFRAVADKRGRFLGFMEVTKGNLALPKGMKYQGDMIRVLTPEKK